MTLDASTKMLETSSGYTDTTSVDISLKSSPLTKSQSHKVLDEVKAGIRHHPLVITQALIATGDWTLA